VLDDDNRVAQIAQALERFNQTVVVALVQADGRLAWIYKNARQRRADLRRQTDALALPPKAFRRSATASGIPADVF
jgi:hypothetical protein